MKSLKLVLILCSLFLLFQPQSSAQEFVPIEIKVVFPFDVAEVFFHSYWDTTLSGYMVHSGSREYSILIDRPENQNTVLLFNIKYKLPEYNSMQLWLLGITGGEPDGDPTGIIYGKLYVNNILLNNSFIARNTQGWTNFYLSVNDDNTINPLHDNYNQPALIDDRIPAEVAWRKRYARQYPSSDYNHLNGWMQVITDNNILNPSKVEVDYLRLYGRLGNTYVLLRDDVFNAFNMEADGGLYLRYPFFPPGFDEHDSMPATVSNSILTFYPSDNRTKVWHWWNSEQTYLPNIYAYDSYRIECKIRITGHALAQGGIDFIKHTNGAVHYELGVSDWYFENNGEWQIVVFDSDDNAPTSNQLIQNVNIQTGESQCFDATHTLTVQDFSVFIGGAATFIAGENIIFNEIVEVESGAQLHAYITTDHSYCIQPESILATVYTDKSSEMFKRDSGKQHLSFSLFPNPTTGTFTLHLKETTESMITVEIYSMIGESIHQTHLAGSRYYELDLSSKPGGVYLIRVIAGDEIGVEKLNKY